MTHPAPQQTALSYRSQPMIRLLIAALFLSALAACSKTPSGPVPSTPAPLQAETAMMLCDATGLAEERSSTLTMAGDSRAALRGSMSEKMSSDTILLEKLNAYEAEIEVAYRDVTRACQLYARCLEGNGNDESLCLRSEARWDDASDRFAELSTEIRNIDASVDKAKIEADRDVAITKAKRPIIVKKKHRHHDKQGTCDKDCCEKDCHGDCAEPCPAPAPKPGCSTNCKTVQSIFTTGCCE
jgi:hypothetical protein